jgi:hypothetical protein
MGRSPQEGISTLQVDEAFATQDDQFVERVRLVASPKYLAGLADRWKRDARPWAREQIFRYLALPMDRPGHHPLVKRLFKQAEANRDDELMAEFVVAFDRLVRRERRMRYHYNYQTRQLTQEEVLVAPRNQILPSVGTKTTQAGEGINPFTGEKVSFPGRTSTIGVPKKGRLFSYKTRAYLRRRAWRYFRRMGFQSPVTYTRAAAAVLAKYRDADVAKGENILDNWSLLNIAFRQSEVLQFSPTRVQLADGRSLAELTAAPKFEELWRTADSAAVLLKLLTDAQSRLVRVWAMQIIKRHHAQSMQQISAEQLLSLLDHHDEEVQQFGASLLETLAAIDTWPIETWLRLLETRSVTALATICQVMQQRVRPERLDVSQCVALACTRATPVARLGLSWLKARRIDIARDRAAIVDLAGAQCEAVGVEIAEFALSILGAEANYGTDDVVAFFDSLNAEVRRGAWLWLTPKSAGYGDAELWARLTETPFDDVRIRMVDELNKRVQAGTQEGALSRQDMTHVWATVLLGVHRGGRAKLKALRQISQRIAQRPDEAERLIPVLAVAIRSVRLPEVRAGLSGILSAVTARPELESILAKWLPELHLSPRTNDSHAGSSSTPAQGGKA